MNTFQRAILNKTSNPMFSGTSVTSPSQFWMRASLVVDHRNIRRTKVGVSSDIMFIPSVMKVSQLVPVLLMFVVESV